MTRGRKPKQNAQRRGGSIPSELAKVEPQCIEQSHVPIPPHIQNNPTMLACWNTLLGASGNFRPEDAPLMDAYCYWYSVYLQACCQSITEDGRVITLCGVQADDGTIKQDMLKSNPDINTAKKATEMMLKLANVLQTTPEARGRSNLISAMTKSTQADVVSKTITSYAQMKALENEA